MKKILIALTLLTSMSSFASPTVVENSFSLASIKSQEGFERNIETIKQQNIEICEKIVEAKNSDFVASNAKQLCSKANNYNYSCSMACGSEKGANILHTPLNSYCSFNCEDGACEDKALINKMKILQIMRNEVSCSANSSGTYGLPSGTKAIHSESDKCVVYKNAKDITVTCHSLCARPTEL